MHVCFKICLNPLKSEFIVILFCFPLYVKARFFIWCNLASLIRYVLDKKFSLSLLSCMKGFCIKHGINIIFRVFL